MGGASGVLMYVPKNWCARSSQMRIRAPPSAMRKLLWHFLKQRKLQFRHFSGVCQRCSEECPVLRGAVFAPTGELDHCQRPRFFSRNDGLCANTFHAFHSCQSRSIRFFWKGCLHPISYPSSLLCGTAHLKRCALSKLPMTLYACATYLKQFTAYLQAGHIPQFTTDET